MHVDTADYWLNTVDQTQYAPYLTYEYPHTAYVPYVKAAGIKTVAYEDAGMPPITSTLPESTIADGTYLDAMATDCNGNAVTTVNGSAHLFDPHASDATQYLQAVVDSKYNAWAPDVAFFDNWNDLYSESAPPCDFSSYADWTSATLNALTSLNMHGAPLFVNTLSVADAYEYPPVGLNVQNQVGGLNSAVLAGGEYERCFANYAKAWTDTENAELQTIAANKTFWCYANGSLTDLAADSASGLTQRLFVYASFLLTYDPDHSIYQTWLQTVSGFKVMPETQFVPTAPSSTLSAISGAQDAGGAYVRTYNACYYAGKLLGACEIIVNPSTTAAVTVPNSSLYTTSAVLQGSDILDGGTVAFTAPVPTSLAPLTAAILLR
jgi:hypothetical protein